MPDETVLILGGTAEASLLARRIAAARPDLWSILSLAGRTKAPILPAGEVRIGGFGGREGLADFVRARGVTRLVDATHPFAAGISRNAAAAALATGTPRLALVRPAWQAVAGDRWIAADCPRAASEALPAGATAFLALGSQHLAPFAGREDIAFVVRMVDPPEAPLPFPAGIILGRPPADWREEAALFEARSVTHLVSRNSGGAASHAKIEAARRLGLPVVMIGRGAEPPPPAVATVEAVMAWLCGRA